MTNIEDVGIAVIIVLRIVAFIVGVGLLISGIADFGTIGSDITIGLSVGGFAVVKVTVGLVLMLAAIDPEIIAVTIKWIIST